MILSAEDLSYSYGDRLLFENITFNVEEGDKYGIIGVNGTGKSTLLRMIANHEAGDGKLTIPGGVVMVRGDEDAERFAVVAETNLAFAETAAHFSRVVSEVRYGVDIFEDKTGC